MQQLSFARPLKRILCLGAHSDDIEIGCGGTILRLTAERPDLEIHWVVFGAQGPRADEARQSAELFLRAAGSRTIVVHSFHDGFFPYQGAEIKNCFEALKAQFAPDLVFTHRSQDAHQDHRLINELTWNTFRHHLILEYEIPKYDGDLSNPNVYVHLDADVCRAKVDHLLACFGTQRSKHWFASDLFYAMLRLRGMESVSPSGFAEALYARKIVL
jgi:LmbE family N-acetylglucosaminyl deacetylase